MRKDPPLVFRMRVVKRAVPDMASSVCAGCRGHSVFLGKVYFSDFTGVGVFPWSVVPKPVLLYFSDCIGKCLCVCLGSGGESELCSLNINTKLPLPSLLSSALSYWSLSLMHPSLVWLPFSYTTKTSPLSTWESHYEFPLSSSSSAYLPGGLFLGRYKRVTAACRWRACESCWLWRLLFAKGWMRRRIDAQLWPCCSETLAPSRWHRPAWGELDCGHPALDLLRLQPLALKRARTY